MITPPIEKILSVMDQKGYRVYNTPAIDWNLNIVGIRNKNIVPDKFDDTLVIFHNFLNHWHISYYPITTDPSIFYLKKPLNPKGTAILLEGQYKSTYKIDKHNGRYYALCQRLADVSVYRDNDKNGTLALQPDTIQTGRFGINIHRGPRNGNWGTDNNPAYSAGCQVFADSRHFNEFMNKCKNGEKAFGNKFTYTLLNEADFL
ncbi:MULTISPECIES: hypothetical protein [Aquimarina]|uniref:hypothetical protein n=1 Tax=Aquimarina TaxID=290174 RepID=UPI000D690DE9|nr:MULTISPECIES: hypothetical protein [Aquimarina]